MPHVQPPSPALMRLVQHGRNCNVSPWRRSACRTKCRVRKLCARPSSLSMAHCASHGRKCSVGSWRRLACGTLCRVLARLAFSASFGALFPPFSHIRRGLEIREFPGPVSETWPAPSRHAGHASPPLARLWRSAGTTTTCKGGIRQEALQVPRPDGFQACQVKILCTFPAGVLHRRHALRGDGIKGDPRTDPQPGPGDANPLQVPQDRRRAPATGHLPHPRHHDQGRRRPGAISLKRISQAMRAGRTSGGSHQPRRLRRCRAKATRPAAGRTAARHGTIPGWLPRSCPAPRSRSGPSARPGVSCRLRQGTRPGIACRGAASEPPSGLASAPCPPASL